MSTVTATVSKGDAFLELLIGDYERAAQANVGFADYCQRLMSDYELATFKQESLAADLEWFQFNAIQFQSEADRLKGYRGAK